MKMCFVACFYRVLNDESSGYKSISLTRKCMIEAGFQIEKQKIKRRMDF